MSEKKKKGNLLELMISIIERSLADNPSTILKRNYNLNDTHGIKREVDIYVETTVNGKTFKYAFECKNYKHGVQLSHIVDFGSRITDQAVKGYFVTTSHYQKGAVEKAKALHIDLLTLKERGINSEDIKGLIFFTNHFEIMSVDIVGPRFTAAERDLFDEINTCPACQVQIVAKVKEQVLPLLEGYSGAGIEAILPNFGDIRKVAKTVGKQNAQDVSINALFDGAWHMHRGQKVNIKQLFIKLKAWTEIQDHSVGSNNVFTYLNESENKTTASFSFSEFLIEDQNLVVGITRANPQTCKISIGLPGDPDSFNTFEAVKLGTIDELGLRDAFKNRSNKKCGDISDQGHL